MSITADDVYNIATQSDNDIVILYEEKNFWRHKVVYSGRDCQTQFRFSAPMFFQSSGTI